MMLDRLRHSNEVSPYPLGALKRSVAAVFSGENTTVPLYAAIPTGKKRRLFVSVRAIALTPVGEESMTSISRSDTSASSN
jgi:hypothetical protein